MRKCVEGWYWAGTLKDKDRHTERQTDSKARQTRDIFRQVKQSKRLKCVCVERNIFTANNNNNPHPPPHQTKKSGKEMTKSTQINN